MATETSGKSCCHEGGNGILFPTPKDAVRGPREKVLFVTSPSYNTPSILTVLPASIQPKNSDKIFTVDVDPSSPTYQQIIGKLDLPKIGDEIHHTGWNACASCFGKSGVCRRYLVCPTLVTSRVYIVDTIDPKDLKIHHIVKRKDLEPLNATFLHTPHCLGDGNIMISALGDNKGDNLGQFIMLNKDFQPIGKWNAEEENPGFNYGFWYQPRHNVMISTEWGSPNAIKHGYDPKHVEKGYYSNAINIWDWTTHKRIQQIKLEGEAGLMGFQIRFVHDPDQPHAFMHTAYGSALYHLFKKEGSDKWEIEMVDRVMPKKVQGFKEPEMPGMTTDFLISMDDKFLYMSAWLQGEIRQYDISDPNNVKLVSKVHIGGLLHKDSKITVEDPAYVPYEQTVVKGKTIHGGPHMMQLSLDGRRLYVGTTLTTPWDQQFYPDMVKEGASLLLVDVDPVNGGMKLNHDFLVDFGKAPDGGRYGVQEMRYPGGDCTSDIWT